jgi:zinc protease
VVPIAAERREALTDDVELAKVYYGWVTPSSFQPGDAELTLAANILADGKASRLQKALMIDKAIASDITAFQYPLQHGSVFSIAVTGNPGQTTAQLEAAVWPVIAGLASAPPTPAELTSALTAWQASTLRQLQALGGFGGKADMLNYYNHHTGDPGYLPKDFARMEAVTPASLQKVYAEQIKADNRVVVVVSPEVKTEVNPVEKSGGAK